MTDSLLLSMNNIEKSFPGVLALRGVNFSIKYGEVIGLVGENGAGKSTLMKILSGVYPVDKGDIVLEGRPYRPANPAEAHRKGISTIFQELSLISHLTVAENIYLNYEPKLRYLPGIIDYKRMNEGAKEIMAQMGCSISPTMPVYRLPIALRQMVEIAKSLARHVRLLIMDEPTSSLASNDIEKLFKLITSLKKRGISTIFIGHRMEEVLGIVDRVVVLRDGEQVGELPIEEATEDHIIRLMVGRQVHLYPKEETQEGAVVLDVKHLSDGSRIRDVSFNVKAGEIVGMAGLVGAGRTEVARMIFGVDPKTSGQVFIDGREVFIQHPEDAIRAGIGLVPEDRKTQGLILGMDVKSNFSLSILARLSSFLGIVSIQQERHLAEQYKQKLNIQTPSLQQIIRNLSGGNQQKVILARWMSMKPKLLILDEPTRGIDIGAKTEVHRLMSELAQQGMGILMISSELPEIFGMSDRVLVMCEGAIAGVFTKEQLQRKGAEEAVIALAGGQTDISFQPATP